MERERKALVCGITSDIGAGIADCLERDNWQVYGTSRKFESNKISKLDLSQYQNVDAFTRKLSQYKDWSLLCFFAGTMSPIGPFFSLSFEEWEKSFYINVFSQLKLLHSLWDYRSTHYETSVCFLAGGGTNSSFDNYSSYCLSKIILIKFVELLASENIDAKFFIIGPGFMRTKIHDETIRAGVAAGPNLEKTLRFMEEEGTSIENLYSHLKWCLSNSREAISGRNFSTVYDSWQSGNSLATALIKNPNSFKLRRQAIDTD